MEIMIGYYSMMPRISKVIYYSHEMYVTDKIDLPANSVVFGPEVQPGLFTFGNIS